MIKDLSGQGFDLTPEQIGNLNRWVEFLHTDESKKWDRDEREASSNFNRILSEAKFSGGKDLDANQLDNLLGNMRRMIKNRALTRLLYMENGISNFNSKLRNLLLGSAPLPKRIDEFYELEWVGKPTMSQFLYASDPQMYPCITHQTFDTIGLHPAQLELAYRQALQEDKIARVEDHNILTLEYLRDWIVYREVKRLLRLELYTHVNHILWNTHRTRRKRELQRRRKLHPDSGSRGFLDLLRIRRYIPRVIPDHEPIR